MAFVIKMFANKKNTQSTTRHSESTSSMKHERPSCIQKLHDRLYWRGYWLQNHLCHTDQPSYVINTYNWYYQHTLTAALLTTLDMWHNGEDIGVSTFILGKCNHHNHFTAFFWDHPGEPVPEENFWTLWCKRRLTEADTDHPAGCHSIRTNQCPPPPNALLINTVPAKHSSIPKKAAWSFKLSTKFAQKSEIFIYQLASEVKVITLWINSCTQVNPSLNFTKIHPGLFETSYWQTATQSDKFQASRNLLLLCWANNTKWSQSSLKR